MSGLPPIDPGLFDPNQSEEAQYTAIRDAWRAATWRERMPAILYGLRGWFFIVWRTLFLTLLAQYLLELAGRPPVVVPDQVRLAAVFFFGVSWFTNTNPGITPRTVMTEVRRMFGLMVVAA